MLKYIKSFANIYSMLPRIKHRTTLLFRLDKPGGLADNARDMLRRKAGSAGYGEGLCRADNVLRLMAVMVDHQGGIPAYGLGYHFAISLTMTFARSDLKHDFTLSGEFCIQVRDMPGMGEDIDTGFDAGAIGSADHGFGDRFTMPDNNLDAVLTAIGREGLNLFQRQVCQLDTRQDAKRKFLRPFRAEFPDRGNDAFDIAVIGMIGDGNGLVTEGGIAHANLGRKKAPVTEDGMTMKIIHNSQLTAPGRNPNEQTVYGATGDINCSP